MSTTVSATALGTILTVGAGVYLQIACSESMPRAAQVSRNIADKAIMIFAFAIGATFVGLVLLDHEHC